MQASASGRTALPMVRQAQQPRRSVAANSSKKAVAYDEKWKPGFFANGYFLESKEQPAVNIISKIESRGILGLTERLGLLSKAQAAGLTLGKVEELGLLSKTEELGLLSAAEAILVSDPGKITSLSLPFVVVLLLALSFFPTDNTAEVVLKTTIALTAGSAAATCFVGGFLVAWLQEADD